MKLPTTILTLFYEIQQLWTADVINKYIKASRDGRNIRHIATVFRVA
jgi:hypothetical protein